MPRPLVSGQIAIAAAAAAAIGVLDAALVVTGVLSATGSFQFVPARLWLIAPGVWMLGALLLCAVLLPVMRTRDGAIVPAVLAAIFAAIRLRGHAAVLLAALALLAALFTASRSWIRPWLARPHRALATGIVAAALMAAGVSLAFPSRGFRVPVPPSRTAAAGPNVIVIFLDTVRYDAVFDAGGRVAAQLPTLARLREESTAFTRAYSASSWTLPAHLSAVTGLPAYQLGVSFDSQVYSRSEPTLAERFHARGYRTAAVISNSFLNAGTGFARGFDTFDQAQEALDLCRTAPGVIADAHWPWFSAAVCNWTASNVTRRALPLMDDTQGPFFLALNYMDAHDPYYVERSCVPGAGYAAALQCLDRALAPIVDWRSSRRPTVLAVVGDHGEQFGEHGLRLHGNSLYMQLLHVPLMVRSNPGGGARTDTQPISIAALPSLVDATSAAPPRDAPVLSVLYPPAAANRPASWSAIDDAWHLIVREHGPDALYSVRGDPAETRDLAPANPPDAAIARLRSAIADMRREPRPDPGKFRSLGYIH